MFIDPTEDELRDFEPQALVLHAPGLESDPEVDGTRSGTFVVLHPSRQEVLIGGTFYAGEIKKSIFTLMNDRLPLEGVFPMHCSANVGDDGDVAIFFGLSGTGKTTLSADPERKLIGDDEHGWGDDGVFNFEGGCYAKVINLSAEAEPEIYKTTRTYGTILENVVLDERGNVDLDDGSKTENTRAAYKLEQIANALPAKRAGHPQSVIFLTADAFGILPPIARLTRDQAMYWFLSGFTAKLAGTEIGVTEPQPTFSACFGAPFLPQHPVVYARLLAKRLDEHGAKVWLVNTGWTGGPFGEGSRMPIKATRALLRAAIAGELAGVEYRTDPLFGFEVPVVRAGRRLEPAAAAADVGRPRGVRRQGTRAGRHVPRELLQVRPPTTTSSPAGLALKRGRRPPPSAVSDPLGSRDRPVWAPLDRGRTKEVRHAEDAWWWWHGGGGHPSREKRSSLGAPFRSAGVRVAASGGARAKPLRPSDARSLRRRRCFCRGPSSALPPRARTSASAK